MSTITKQKLRELIEEAYDTGYHGCLDLKEEYAEEVLESLFSKSEAEWKIYKINELFEMPVGTQFIHKRLGECWIEGSSPRNKHMEFVNGEAKYFSQDIDPWDEPMKLVLT
jgi:hypothetical protein